MTAFKEAASDVNQRVREFLTEFIKSENSPQSAVLINGPWGSGKTHFIKEFIDDHSARHRFYYVTLDGVSTAEEFSESVLFAIYAALKNTTVRKFLHIGRSAFATYLKYKGIESDLNLKKIFEQKKRGIYVFDDLERAKMPIRDLLGRINELVEHAGCRVLILAHEEELTADKEAEATKDFLRRKEKTIGWTLALRCEADAGLNSFLESVTDAEVKPVLNDARAELLAAFQNSKTENLRLLQQAIWDLERAIPKIRAQFRRNDAFKTFIAIAAALAMEIKRGSIQRSDLQDAAGYARTLAAASPHAAAAPDDPFQAFARKHPGISFYDVFVRSPAIHDWLFHGQIHAEALNAVFASDSRFADPSQIPSWQIAWDWRNKNDVVETAITDMRERLETSAYRIDGEILHVYGILIDYAHRKWIKDEPAELLKSGKDYVDALTTDDTMDVRWSSLDNFGLRRGYANLGFSGSDRPEFKELAAYLLAKAREVLASRAQKEFSSLLALMEREPLEFVRRLCPVGSNTSDLWRIPVLASIPAHVFAKALLSIHPRSLFEIAPVFKDRYGLSRQSPDLDAEAAWLDGLKCELEQALVKSPPITQHQVKHVIEQIDEGRRLISKPKNEDAPVQK